jgi:hypothetical protein
MTELKDRTQISADELEARMQAQEKYHDAPLRNVTEFIEGAIRRVLKELGVDVTQDYDLIIAQKDAMGIKIASVPLEMMGKLSGLYVSRNNVPIANIGDAFMAKNGLAYLKILWIRKDTDIEELFGGVRIIQ